MLLSGVKTVLSEHVPFWSQQYVVNLEGCKVRIIGLQNR
jgi:hypothetical protein